MSLDTFFNLFYFAGFVAGLYESFPVEDWVLAKHNI
jgi:hypothetical protein